MQIEYYTISYVNNYLKNMISNDRMLQKITLKGEISNLTWRGGHAYFSLKDKDSTIRAILFSGDRWKIMYEPKNGDEVFAYGSVEVYSPLGTYQIIIKDMMLVGEGERLLQLEKLRMKLQNEGLFSIEHKLQIPKYPKTIGVITSLNGAAIHDIYINILKRYPIVKIHHFESAVQGKKAVSELMNALKSAIVDKVDVIIIGRGGGDSDDLSAFNDESLVRAIYDSPIPVISAVGHESDTTLVDYVCDKRVSTPTAAAVAATPNYNDLAMEISSLKQNMERYMQNKLSMYDNYLKNYYQIIQSKNPRNDLITKHEKLNMYLQNMKRSIEIQIENYRKEVPIHLDILNSNTKQYLEKTSLRLNHIDSTLESLNPFNILKRGYSIATTSDGKVITSVSEVEINQEMKTTFKDGILISNIKKKENK